MRRLTITRDENGHLTNSAQELQELTDLVNQTELSTALELDLEGRIEIRTEYQVPTCWHHTTRDLLIEDDRWEPLTGLTGQWNYNGAVMHDAETFSPVHVRALLDLRDDQPVVFACVPVEDPEDPERGPEGWAVIHRTTT